MKIKIETKKEIKEIVKLLQARDEESRYLGYAYYRTSKFRKYVRNKLYAYKDKPNQKFKFPMYSLNLNKQENLFNEIHRVSTNESNINLVRTILVAYIQNDIIFYGKKRR